MRVLALCGGVGGAKLAEGLHRCLAPGELSVVVNTGDDFQHLGLWICPDLDTVLYTLAGVANPEQGWGRAGESWQVQAELQSRGVGTWFQLGDRDIALHLMRAERRARGESLTAITRELADSLGVRSVLLPMCDEPAPTTVLTDEGELSFQHYFVKHRCAPRVRGFRYGGTGSGRLTDAVRETFGAPDLGGIVVCPSNPYLSIDPILAIPGLRALLASAQVPIVAVSPVVGGAAVKGPTTKIMHELGVAATPLEVTRHYGDFVDLMLIDLSDDEPPPEPAGPDWERAPIVMRTADDRSRLAAICLEHLLRLRGEKRRRRQRDPKIAGS